MHIKEFKEISPQLLQNEPMSDHTTFKIGGVADMYVSAGGVEEIKALIKLAKATKTPYMIIGNGSNLLVSDKGIRGLVIEIGKDMSECRVDGNMLYAEAGVLMSKVASIALQNSLTGYEELSGIPGTLGGGIYMNAGAYGGEIKNVVKTVTYLDSDGEIKEATPEECEFGYRTSIFEAGDKVILSAVLELEKGNPEEIKERMADYSLRRRTKQPIAYPSAGSTFKRPEGYFAGALIEGAELKGYSSGGAQISELHAGFVINIGDATAQDVLDVINHAKAVVKEKYGVVLEPEVRLIGEGM